MHRERTRYTVQLSSHILPVFFESVPSSSCLGQLSEQTHPPGQQRESQKVHIVQILHKELLKGAYVLKRGFLTPSFGI